VGKIASENFILGLGLMFGLAIFTAYIVELNLENFFGFLTFYSAFVIWMGLLPIWILIINLLILLVLIINSFKGGGLI
jgi:hypothetical protein